MFENNESYKYLGTAMFFLTALFIIFGLNIWIITLSLILFLGFSSWYLIYGKTDATYKF